jgi:hypothetical protein
VNRIERAAFACAWSGVRFAWYGARGQQPPADHGVRLETRPPAAGRMAALPAGARARYAVVTSRSTAHAPWCTRYTSSASAIL